MAPDKMGFVRTFDFGRGAPLQQHRVEDVLRQVAAERSFVPIIFGGDGADTGADFRGQGGPQHHEIEMSPVVGEVDALAFVGLAARPLNLYSADTTSNGGEHASNGMDVGAHERGELRSSSERGMRAQKNGSETAKGKRSSQAKAKIGAFAAGSNV